MSSEYKNIEYRYRFLKETAKNFNSGSRNAIYRQEREKKENSLSRTEQNFLESIRKDSVHRKETIQDIVLKCSNTSFEIYRDEIKRLAWENSKLREELRQISHVKDKNSKEGKQREQIISRKNEQIRKISQELKDMSSELNKVKAGNHKMDDRLKKGKKNKRSSYKKKQEKILEIPVLPEISNDDAQMKDARDIFFYDIPKFWSEEEVRTNLMKIGKVFRIQIRGQYKYKTVKAKIALSDNFEKSFKEGHFGTCINKFYIRWYDAKINLKGRQERDRWQVVRDLTNEEMTAIKTEGSYEFTKRLQNETKMDFTKIIKITKNWKVIGYFKNQKVMEEAIEDSCTKGDINRIWLVRNKKTIYREDRKEKRPKEESGTNRLNSEQRKTEETPDKTLPSTIGQVEPKTPITPRNSYMELEKLGQFNLKVPPRYFNPRKPKTPNEEEVVDAISKWRLTDAISPDDQTANHLEKGKEKQKEPLKKDNVAPEEVVEIIKEYRSDKIAYTRLSDSPTDNELRKKVGEIEEIFDVNYHLMEWKAIQGEIIDEIKEEKKMSGMNDFRKWMNEEKNYLILAKKVIIRAENHGLFQVFTEMNEDFSKRLEDENRYQDNKEIGDKRPILESPEVPEREPWLVTAEGSEEEEDEEEGNKKNIEDQKEEKEKEIEEKNLNKSDPAKIKEEKKKKKKKNRNYRK
ncbi:unnamed protein product [Rhizophagus irregularis]|nr:unnamed protein product [Rhizophagus irregularis]